MSWLTGERGVFPVSDHPSDDGAAEDVDEDVEVEVRLGPRSEEG